MVTTTALVAHLTVVLALLFCSLDSTAASMDCKRTMMGIIADQCMNNGARRRRDLSEALLKTGRTTEDLISGAISDARRGYQPQWAGRFAGPPPPYPMALSAIPRVYPDSPQYYAAAPRHDSSLFSPESVFPNGFLPPESGGHLGFDLTSEEVDELYVAISNRMSRNSSGKDSARVKRNFHAAAAKCCQNEDLCRKEPPLITCP